MAPRPRAKRLGAIDRRSVHLQVDGIAVQALEGDTVLTAILLHGGKTGADAFNQTKQAGFCLMGACQSCWVWTSNAQRLRACDAEVKEGLEVFTTSKGAGW